MKAVLKILIILIVLIFIGIFAFYFSKRPKKPALEIDEFSESKVDKKN